MPIARRVFKNTIAVLGGRVFSRLLAFGFTVVIARKLGVLNYGKYNFAVALVTLFALFADFGISTYTVREVAKNLKEDTRFLGDNILLHLMFSTLVFAALILTILVFPQSADTKIVVVLIGVSMILASLASSFGAILEAHQYFWLAASVNIAHQMVMVSVGLMLLFEGFGIKGLGVAQIIAAAMYIFILMLIFRKLKIRPLFKVDWARWECQLKSAVPLGISAIFVAIYYKLDSIILAGIKGNTAVGLYGAAYTLINGLILVPLSFTAVLFPVFSKLIENKEEDRIKSIYATSFKYLLLLAIPIAFGTIATAPKIIKLIYGTSYLASAVALQLLIWVAVLIFVNSLQGTFLIADNQQIFLTKVATLAALLNIVFNFLLIPNFGIQGAAAATIIAEATAFLACMIRLQKHFSWNSLLRLTITPLFASVLMAVFLYLIQVSLLFQVAVAAFAYFITLILLRYFKRGDMLLLKNILHPVDGD